MKTQNILITGGTRGIGKAIAERFKLENENASNSNSSGLLNTATSNNLYEIYAPGSQECNLESQVSIKEYIDLKFKQLSSLRAQQMDNYQNQQYLPQPEINTLIFNAGVHFYSQIENIDLVQIERIFSINLISIFRVLHEVQDLLAKGSSIIFISSIAAKLGEAEASAYSASKSAIKGLMKSLAAELAYKKIRVNSVLPGWVRTDMSLGQLSNQQNLIDANLGATVIDRWIEVSEIADMVFYLSSKKASAITGQEFIIDGGLSI